jgi:hypothetical protein
VHLEIEEKLRIFLGRLLRFCQLDHRGENSGYERHILCDCDVESTGKGSCQMTGFAVCTTEYFNFVTRGLTGVINSQFNVTDIRH